MSSSLSGGLGAMSEHSEQVRLMAWLYVMRPDIERQIFAVPNGGLRNARVAGQLKAEGVKPGVPDLFLPVARGGHHGLFIEMKVEAGGRLSQAQRDWQRRLRGAGYRAEVCHGPRAAYELLLEYVGPEALPEMGD